MLLNIIAKRMMLNAKVTMKFSGGHHHHVYDWRDDHTKNPDLFEDPRTVNIQPAEQYTFPYSAKPQTWILSHPESYNPKDLTTNMTGTPVAGMYNYPDSPVTDYLADCAHEYDYESEDLDFQPESFGYQHFRKQGPMWMNILIGLMPLLFFGNEMFYQFWPDVDNWRYQRPPPLNYPNDAETNDTEVHNLFQTSVYKDFVDSGLGTAPWFNIVDGKKVYTQWAGVNEPRDAI